MRVPARPQRGFPPVIDAQVRLLVLGRFPSEASLAAGQYYAHPRNQFWVILGDLLGESLRELDYADRLARVLSHRIGIWDVLDACERAGSLDSDIRAPQPNDFARLQQLAPALERVCFNGQTAGRFAPMFGAAGYQTVVLPSTSPAHAGRSLAQKITLWRAAFAGFLPG